jgi:hypothetical protein
LKDHHGEFKNLERFGERYYEVHYWASQDLARALKFSKGRTTRSLERLKRQGRAKLMRDGWTVSEHLLD